MIHLWLRDECKRNEQRAALTPKAVEKLLATGNFKVEESKTRAFDDSEYRAVAGCTVTSSLWMNAPLDVIIIGLKELPEIGGNLTGGNLVHTHILFAHCYKNQDGYLEQVQARRVKYRNHSRGILLDLEFLSRNGRRVAAFGYHAGFAGAAIAYDVWAHQSLTPQETYPSLKPYKSTEALVSHINSRVALAISNGALLPKIIITGALGRCGTGASDLTTQIQNTIPTKWDLAETRNPGPYEYILTQSIFINCIYLTQKIPPFITKEMCKSTVALSVICDVSCDSTNPNNPLPYYGSTTFDDPLIHIEYADNDKRDDGRTGIDVIAIDHLPTLLPREASDAFCADLMATLLELPKMNDSEVWTGALELFKEKCASIPQII